MVRLLSRQHGRTGRCTQSLLRRQRFSQDGGKRKWGRRPLQLLLQMDCGFTRVLRDSEVVSDTIGAL